MLANYHAHTTRCGHATGTEREYIEKAIEGGYKAFGFSDHTPYPFTNGYTSHIRMKMQELEDYCSTILQLKEEYSSDITIHLGLEVEYYPAHFERLKKAASDMGVEYFLLGQHFTNNEYDGFYAGRPCGRDILEKYSAQCIEGMETGSYLYFAHPDLIHFTEDEEVYKEYMRPVCKAAKRLNIPLEINILGLWSGRNYPNPLFWELAAEEGNDAVLGLDCHDPGKILVPDAVSEAGQMARRLGINVIEDLEARLRISSI